MANSVRDDEAYIGQGSAVARRSALSTLLILLLILLILLLIASATERTDILRFAATVRADLIRFG